MDDKNQDVAFYPDLGDPIRASRAEILEASDQPEFFLQASRPLIKPQSSDEIRFL